MNTNIIARYLYEKNNVVREMCMFVSMLFNTNRSFVLDCWHQKLTMDNWTTTLTRICTKLASNDNKMTKHS